jgi:hypothetical protein
MKNKDCSSRVLGFNIMKSIVMWKGIEMSRPTKVLIVAVLLTATALVGCSASITGEAPSQPLPAMTLPVAYTETPAAAAALPPTISTVISPSPTYIPETTPKKIYPTLVPESFHIVYIREGDQGLDLVFANTVMFGTGRRVIHLPEFNQSYRSPIELLSPDGRYFAYHTGEVTEQGGDLTLHILRLEDETEIATIRLVTEDVADQMLALAERLAQNPSDQLKEAFWSDEPIPSERIAGEGMYALPGGLRAMDWSPDSSKLAFAAQIDGPTSDLYIYDVNTGDIRRLSSGPQQIRSLEWSPDGQWIAHESAYYVGMQSPTTFNFASRDGSTVFSVDTHAHMRHGWYGSGVYVVTNAANGPGRFGLEAILTQTQRANMLWEDTYYGYVLDWPGGKLLVRTGEERIDEQGNPVGYEPGIYLVDFNQGSIELINGFEEYTERFNIGMALWDKSGEFALLNLDDEAYALDAEGHLRSLIEGAAIVGWASPDGSVIMIRWHDSERISWYMVDLEAYLEFSNEVPDCVSWRPDSQLFVYTIDSVLYYQDMQRDQSILLDDQVLDGSCAITWVPGW